MEMKVLGCLHLTFFQTILAICVRLDFYPYSMNDYWTTISQNFYDCAKMNFAKGTQFRRSLTFYSRTKGSRSLTEASRRPTLLSAREIYKCSARTQEENGDPTRPHSDVSGIRVYPNKSDNEVV